MKKVVKGQPFDSREWNALEAELKRLSNLTVASPLELVKTGAGQMVRYVDTSVVARLTDAESFDFSYATCPQMAFGWEEVQPDGFGGWITVPQGRSGSIYTNPAYELNAACVALGTIVKLYPVMTLEKGAYVFEHCCAHTHFSSSSSVFNCCNGYNIPLTLYLFCAGDLITCPCSIPPITLTWQPLSHHWTGGTIAGSCTFQIFFEMYCGLDRWHLDVTLSGDCVKTYETFPLVTCPPFTMFSQFTVESTDCSLCHTLFNVNIIE